MKRHVHEVVNVLRSEANALLHLADYIDEESYAKALDILLATKGKVVVTGIGKSGLIGAKIAATMASTGTPSQFMHTGDAGHGDMGMAQHGDAIIAISASGQSREFIAVITYAKKMNIPIIAITANSESLLGRSGDVILLLPNIEEACPLKLAPMTSTTMTLAIGDGLAAALIQARGFKREDFGLRHLSGSLGARTKTVGDYLFEMGNQNNFPQVETMADFKTILRVVSSGRLGATAVVTSKGHLAGIITDGDIRRGLEKDNLNALAQDIMTSSPRIVPYTMTLLEVLDIMRSKAISVILADAQNDNPAKERYRFIHLQDLLALGL